MKIKKKFQSARIFEETENNRKRDIFYKKYLKIIIVFMRHNESEIFI